MGAIRIDGATLSNSVTLTDQANICVWGSSTTGTISGTLTAEAGVNRVGAGTLNVTGTASTVSGTISFSAGSLSMTAGTVTDATVTVPSGSTLTLGDSAGITSLTNAGTATIGASATIGEIVSNTSTLTLGATATVTTVTANSGTLTLGADASIATVTDNTGTISLGGATTLTTVTGGTGSIASGTSGTEVTVTIESGDVSEMTLTDVAINKIGTGTLALGTHRPTITGVSGGVITLTANGNYTFGTTLEDQTLDTALFTLLNGETEIAPTSATVASNVLTLTSSSLPTGAVTTTITGDTNLATLLADTTVSWSDTWSGVDMTGYTDGINISSESAVTLTVPVSVEDGSTPVALSLLTLDGDITLKLVSATEGTTATLASSQSTTATVVNLNADVIVSRSQLTATAITISGAGTLLLDTATTTALCTTAVSGVTGLTETTWTGTVQLPGVTFAESSSSSQTGYIETLGNTGSTVELLGTSTGYLRQAGSCSINLKVTGKITFSNGYSKSGGYTFSGKLTGEGEIATSGAITDVIAFTGDVSEFAGIMNVGGSHCIAIGTRTDDDDATAQVNCLYVAADKSITIPSGKTWTAGKSIYVAGTLDVVGSTASAVTVAEGGVVTISGGTISGATTVAEGGSLSISSGTLSGATTVTGSVAISGGTVSGDVAIESAGTVTLSSATALTGAVTGSGTLVFSGIAPTTANLADSGLTDSESWTGTVSVVYAASSSTRFYLESYGNASSTVEFNGSTGYLTPNDGTEFSANIKLTGDGWKSTNGNSEATLTFTGSLTGDGTLDLSGGTPSKGHVYNFTGTASDFAGAITVGSIQSVVFGTVTTAGLGTITIASPVNVASGKTWTAGNGFTVAAAGTIGGAGTLSGAVTLADGATIDCTAGALTITGAVTVEGTVNVAVPTTVTAGTQLVAWSSTPSATTFVATSTLSSTYLSVEEDGLYARAITVPDTIVVDETKGVTATDVATATSVLQTLAAEAGVAEITSITGTTMTDSSSPTSITDIAQLVGALTCFDNVATVDADGTATVTYNFGISKMVPVVSTFDGSISITVTVSVTNASTDTPATMVENATVTLIGDDTETIATATADGTDSVTFTGVSVDSLTGKTISVKITSPAVTE